MTVDTTAPVAPAIMADVIVNLDEVALAGTAEANSTVKVYDGATLLGSTTANGTGAWTYTTAALSNGAHSLTATATDVAGNTSEASAVAAVTVDIPTPTTPTITSFSIDSGTVGDGVTNDKTLTLIGTAGANTTVNLYDGATLLGSATADGSGAWSFITGVLANGIHSFTVTAATPAGVSSTLAASVVSDALVVTIDATAPVAPSITSFSPDSGVVGDHITNDNTLTLTGTAEANSTVNVYDGTMLLGSATTNGTGAWSFITAALTDGAHSLTAAATDAAGNTGAASTALSVTIDTTAPVVPSIASFSTDSGVVGDHITNDNTLTLTGTAEANSTVKVYDGATLLGSVTANGTGAWTYTTAALANGAHSLTATATDVAGNTGVASSALAVTIDTIAPVVSTITSFSTDSGVVGDHITNDNTLTLTGTAEANATVKVYDGTTLLGSAMADGTGAWSYTTAVLSNGVHNLTAKATDVAGNTGVASSALSVTIDTTAPVVPTIASFSTDSGIAGDHITSDNTLTLTGTAEANSTVKVYDGATLLGSATANGTGAWSLTTAALTDGAHSLTATATDAAGNTSTTAGALSLAATTTGLSVTIDTAAPVAPSIVSFSTDSGVVGDHITNDNTLTLTGAAEANSTVKVYDGVTLLGSVTANGSGAWTYTTTALANGAHSLTATATDAAGNAGVASSALAVTIDTIAPVAPTIASFSTDSGVAGDHITSDNTLTLTGTAEANSTVKLYDGATLLGSATADNSGAWSYTTDALSNGAHSLTTTDSDAAGNTGVASGALSVTIDTTAPVAPTITSFAPDTGTIGDGVTFVTDLILAGTAEANRTVKVYDGAMLLGSAITNGTGAWSLTTGTLTDGAHGFTATAADAAGNTGTASLAFNVTVETSGVPDPVTITGFGTQRGSGGLTGTAEENSAISIYDGHTGALLGQGTASSTGTWSLNVKTSTTSVNDFIATAIDQAGNTGFTHVLSGTKHDDTIATSAANEVLFGNGGADTFVLSGGGIGHTTIADFQAADVLQLSHNAFASFADVLAHAAQVGTDVAITIDPSDSVTLHNTTLAQLTTNNFHLV